MMKKTRGGKREGAGRKQELKGAITKSIILDDASIKTITGHPDFIKAGFSAIIRKLISFTTYHKVQKERCGKCHHALPQDRRTWKPCWKKWKKIETSTYHYAGDGPLLGIVRHVKNGWAAYVTDGALKWSKIGIFETCEVAKNIIETEVKNGKLWP